MEYGQEEFSRYFGFILTMRNVNVEDGDSPF